MSREEKVLEIVRSSKVGNISCEEASIQICLLFSVVGQSEQLHCDCSKHATYFDEEKKPRCKNCNERSWLAR